MVEGDRLLTFGDQPLVDDVEHLQEGHVGVEVRGLVGLHLAWGAGAGLPPDAEGEFHGGLQEPEA